MAWPRINPVLKGVDGRHPGEKLYNAFEMVTPCALRLSSRIELFEVFAAEQFHAHRSHFAKLDGRVPIRHERLVARRQRMKRMTGLVQDGFHVALQANGVHK